MREGVTLPKRDVVGRELQAANADGGSLRAVAAPAPDHVVHDLSVPGGRPLCGADAVVAPPRVAEPVSCPSCARLLGDEARRRAHFAAPHLDEPED